MRIRSNEYRRENAQGIFLLLMPSREECRCTDKTDEEYYVRTTGVMSINLSWSQPYSVKIRTCKGEPGTRNQNQELDHRRE